jgi:protein tyrosine phosphatase (PTP) superfamily phosphohydrolase (DUF442 family)
MNAYYLLSLIGQSSNSCGDLSLSFHALLIQVAFLYAPLLHVATEQVTPNLYRGPDPKTKDIYELHDKGIKTIISLRTNPERRKQRLCEKLGMQWIQIKTGVFKTPTDEQFDQFRAIVNDPKRCPCYTCCEIDMDRTGVYLAAYRLVDKNWSTEQIKQEFNIHHQKDWWPIFRKYQKVATAYARSKQQPNGVADVALSKTNGTMADDPKPSCLK